MTAISPRAWTDAFGEGLDLLVIVMSTDPDVIERVSSEVPTSLNVVGTVDPARVAHELVEPTILAAVVIDMDVPPEQRALILHEIQQKWPVPRLALVCRSPLDAAALEASQAHKIVQISDAEPEGDLLKTFLRGSLDSCLRWVARYLGFAVNRRLDGELLGLYVAVVIRQVPRALLPDFLGVGETTVQRRIAAMLVGLEIGGGTLNRLHHYLNNIASYTVSPWDLTELERGAEAQRKKLAAANQAQL